ncbi:MAG: hypothetical protein EZS28_054118, partial [Streblomastix strix]
MLRSEKRHEVSMQFSHRKRHFQRRICMDQNNHVIYKVVLEQVMGVIIVSIWKAQLRQTTLMRNTVRWKELGQSKNAPKGRNLDEEEQPETTSREDQNFLDRRGEKESSNSKNAYSIQDLQ